MGGPPPGWPGGFRSPLEALSQDLKLDDSQKQSLKNLRTFPFVADVEEKGRLALHGAHFDIKTGTLSVLNHSRGARQNRVCAARIARLASCSDAGSH